MKYYKDKNNEVYAFEADGSQDAYIPQNLTPITEAEADELRALPAPPVPSVVSMRQARLALLGAGILTQVNDALAGMEGLQGEAARIEWEYAATVDRNSPLVDGLVAALNLDAAALDNLFTVAAGL